MTTQQQLDQFLITGGGLLHVDGDWPAADDLLGEQIGAFKLVEVLGSGGMATVYRGQRADAQFEQQVAIKIIHAGLTDALLRDRFLNERQILAKLNHPNIAHVFDGGVTDDGRPFLVMDLIAGQVLDDWCDTQQLDVAARLELISKVADAVQYAHNQLIAHRDLKPGNILVNEHGEPQLLDFGIAGLFDDSAVCNAFTPLYAAPEQVRGEPAGQATDIYQLGVLAYKLLTHRSPYGDVTGIDSAELRHRIVDEHVPLMSWADRDLAHTSQLKGDLDAIIAHCLEKDPAARYPAVAMLSDDLQAWRDDRPVSVASPTYSYAFSKFLRRQRVPALIAGGFLALLIVASGWYLKNVNQARDQAELAAQQAGEVAGFLEGLLRSVDPIKGGGAQSFSDRLATAGTQLATSDVVDADVKYELLSLLTETLFDRGDYPAVIEMLEPVTATTSTDQHRADYLSLLGYAHYRNGNLPRGRALMTDSFEIQSRGEPSLPLAMTMERMALLERRSGNYQRARELAEQALQIKQATVPEDDLQIGTARNSLALSLQELGEYQAAADQFRQAIEGYRIAGNAQPLRTAMTLSNLADVQRSLGELDQAEAAAGEAVTLARAARQDNPQLLATALTTLGNVQFAKTDYPAAISSYDEALEAYRGALGDDHPRLVAPGYNRAVALRQLDQCAAAVEAVTPIQRIADQALPDGHPQRGAIAQLIEDCAIE